VGRRGWAMWERNDSDGGMSMLVTIRGEDGIVWRLTLLGLGSTTHHLHLWDAHYTGQQNVPSHVFLVSSAGPEDDSGNIHSIEIWISHKNGSSTLRIATRRYESWGAYLTLNAEATAEATVAAKGLRSQKPKPTSSWSL
jgi:hypothetical protein